MRQLSRGQPNPRATSSGSGGPAAPGATVSPATSLLKNGPRPPPPRGAPAGPPQPGAAAVGVPPAGRPSALATPAGFLTGRRRLRYAALLTPEPPVALLRTGPTLEPQGQTRRPRPAPPAAGGPFPGRSCGGAVRPPGGSGAPRSREGARGPGVRGGRAARTAGASPGSTAARTAQGKETRGESAAVGRTPAVSLSLPHVGAPRLPGGFWVATCPLGPRGASARRGLPPGPPQTPALVPWAPFSV